MHAEDNVAIVVTVVCARVRACVHACERDMRGLILLKTLTRFRHTSRPVVTQ